MEDINNIKISQSVAILIDGNNIKIPIRANYGEKALLDYGRFVPMILNGRSLSRFYYFREGKTISEKFTKRLKEKFFGTVVPCWKSVDVKLAITAVQISEKVDTIIIFSGDKDYYDLVHYLKNKGIRVEVAGIKSAMSESIIKVADNTFLIEKEYLFTQS